MIAILQSKKVSDCVEDLTNRQAIRFNLRLVTDFSEQQSAQPDLMRGSLVIQYQGQVLTQLFICTAIAN